MTTQGPKDCSKQTLLHITVEQTEQTIKWRGNVSWKQYCSRTISPNQYYSEHVMEVY